ncbi:elongation factor P [Patescibacteria group bacterium]|nr:elongation factor P [Patescibacteria group bacterium]MDE1946407.1 elongation factor P [Patescibacteria group bacterium]MDE2011016.1 elongation factor P [Patescibacteria group bacterium]
MSILEYNEITEKKFIVMDGTPYEVLSSHVFRKQQRKPVNATKLKNLMTGKVTEYSFHQSEKAEEAEIDSKEVKYLYNNRGKWWFSEVSDPSKRFEVAEEAVGSQGKFLKPNTAVKQLLFREKPMGFQFPITVELKVTEAPPAIKGDTATGGQKVVTVETGATVNAPLFVNEGDIIRVNTDTGEYRERVNK